MRSERVAREVLVAVFAEAVAACDPAARVAVALRDEVAPVGARIGLAVGKAAVAMARGAAVARGLIVAHALPPVGELPAGWTAIEAGHPGPDARSVAAAAAARALVAAAGAGDVVLALISGGASALLEDPRCPLAELVAAVGALMAAGAPIAELNTVRGALSTVKAGQLVAGCAARVRTLIASDVIGDDPAVIGSGPTVGPWLAAPGREVEVGGEARRRAALAILARHAIAAPAVLAVPRPSHVVRRSDRAEVIAPLAAFAEAVRARLPAHGIAVRAEAPVCIAGEVAEVARALAGLAGGPAAVVAYGEPTLRLPAQPGQGGRAQQLALELARHYRGTSHTALVAGTDGRDGPGSAAGAVVDGATWDRLRAAGVDPDAALARCDAGAALDRIGALLVTGPTGVNHADIVIQT